MSRQKATHMQTKFIDVGNKICGNGVNAVFEFRPVSGFSKYYSINVGDESKNKEYEREMKSEINTCVESPFIPKGFNSIEEMADFCQNEFEMPTDVRNNIGRLSAECVKIINRGKSLGIKRKQEKGRFDSRAMPRVLKDLQKNKFSAQNTAPFKQRQKKNPSKPSVLLLADASYSRMWSDENYIPNICVANYALSEACKAAGFNFESMVANDSMSGEEKSVKHHRANVTYMQSSFFNESPSFQDIACLFHRELYRCGSINYKAHCPEAHKANGNRLGEYGQEFEKLSLQSPDKKKIDGVYLLKELFNSQFVITIGIDSKFSDVSISSSATENLKKLCKEVSEKLAEIRQ